MSHGIKGSTSQAAPWDKLRAWIDEKEAWERQNGEPAPLSAKELAAIANLVSFVPEPDIGDKDHVSALMRFLQARQEDFPEFKSEGPVEMNVAGLKESLWRCWCSLRSVQGVFPRVGFGFQQGEEPPVFKTKKNAKQFAAQQALAYLEQTGPHHSSPSPNAPMPKRHRIDPSASSPSIPAAATPSTTSVPPKFGSTKQATEPSIFDCVARLASKLGLDPPKYQIQPDEAIPSLWRGYADFGPTANVPADMGLVTQVLGKQEAKVLVAEKLLVWLNGENEGRQQTIRELMGRAGVEI